MEENLPPLISLSANTLLNHQKYEKSKQEIKEIADSVIKFVENGMKIWDYPTISLAHNKKKANWQFKLPDTVFDVNEAVLCLNVPEFKRENLPRTQLTSDQLSQAWKSGKFVVPSPRYPIPYTWRLSKWVILGSEGRAENFQQLISASVYLIIYIADGLINEHPISLRNGIKKTLYALGGFFNIFFGLRMVYPAHDRSEILRRLEQKRQETLALEISDPIFIKGIEEFYVFPGDSCKKNDEAKLIKVNELMSKLEIISGSIKKDIEEQNEILRRRWESGKIEENEFIHLSFTESEKIFREAIEKSQFEENFKKFLNFVAQLFNSERFHDKSMQKLIKEEIKKFEENLNKQHSVLSKLRRWTQSRVDKARTEISIEGANGKIKSIVGDFGRDENFASYLYLYRNFFEKKDQFEKQVNDLYKKEARSITKPCYVFEIERNLFPPFEVKYDNYYHLIRTKTYSISTSYYGWKVHLLLTRFYCWTINIFIFLFWNAIQGCLGLKALIWCTNYYSDVYVDTKTGEIKGTSEVKPVVQQFLSTMNGISKSRKNFEDAPDTGLFGKNCARIWNYLECYLFRFLFVGIFVVLICYPILIILNSTLSFVLALTSWVWVIVSLIFRQLFIFLVYDYDNSYASNYKYRGIKTTNVFPIIYEVLYLIIAGVCQMVVGITYFCISPVLSFLMLIISILYFVARTLYDSFMYFIIKCLGKTPLSDTKLAWLESGPGISTNFYFTLDEDSVYFIIKAELEKIQLQHYEENAIKEIEAPMKECTSKLKKFFRLFGVVKSCPSELVDNVKLLKEALREQVKKREEKLPKAPTKNISFSTAELENLINQTKLIVKDHVEKYHMDYIWKDLGLRADLDSFEDLTKGIWKKAFSTGNILEPRDDLESRLTVVNEAKSLHMSSFRKVKDAIEGEVELNNRTIQVRSKPAIKADLKPFKMLREVAELVKSSQNYSTYVISNEYQYFLINFESFKIHE